MKTTEISELDRSYKDNYEQKLAETLRDLRDQYETELRLNKDEVMSIYDSKVMRCQTLQSYEFSFLICSI